MKNSQWALGAALLLAACTTHHKSGLDASDAGVSESDAQAEGDAGATDDVWQPVRGASADVNRYMEAVCRIAVECGGDTLQACHDSYEGFYCEPAFADLELPELDACISARTRNGCKAALLSECFQSRKALREGRGHGSTLARLGEACDDQAIRCDHGLFCSAEVNQCGACVATRHAGEACANYDECDSDLYCAKNGTCTKQLTVGSACDENIDLCASGFCKQGKCSALKEAKYGEACDSDDDCYSGFCVNSVCAGAAICGEGKLGDVCWEDATCGAKLACDVSTARCVAQIADGKPCNADEPYCAPSSYCAYTDDTFTSAVCKPKLAIGAVCTVSGQLHRNEECASEACGVDGKCTAGTPICK